MTSMGIIKIILWTLSMHQRKSQVLSMFILAPFICLNFQIEAVPLGARNHPASVVPEYAVPVSEFAAESASQLLCWRTVLNGTCCDANIVPANCVGCLCVLQAETSSDGNVFRLTPTDGDGWGALEFGHEDQKCVWIPVLCNYTGHGPCCIARPDLQRSVKCTSFLNPTKPTTCP